MNSVRFAGTLADRSAYQCGDEFGPYTLTGPTFGGGVVYLTIPGWSDAIRVDDPDRFGDRFGREWCERFAHARTDAANTPSDRLARHA